MTKLIKFCRIYIYIIIMQQLLEEQKVMKKNFINY